MWKIPEVPDPSQVILTYPALGEPQWTDAWINWRLNEQASMTQWKYGTKQETEQLHVPVSRRKWTYCTGAQYTSMDTGQWWPYNWHTGSYLSVMPDPEESVHVLDQQRHRLVHHQIRQVVLRKIHEIGTCSKANRFLLQKQTDKNYYVR
jgi:hypothetical protein